MSIPNRTLPIGNVGVFLALAFAYGGSGAVFAQLSESAKFAAQAGVRYQITPNITYLTANNFESKLDVYQPPMRLVHGRL